MFASVSDADFQGGGLGLSPAGAITLKFHLSLWCWFQGWRSRAFSSRHNQFKISPYSLILISRVRSRAFSIRRNQLQISPEVSDANFQGGGLGLSPSDALSFKFHLSLWHWFPGWRSRVFSGTPVCLTPSLLQQCIELHHTNNHNPYSIITEKNKCFCTVQWKFFLTWFTTEEVKKVTEGGNFYIQYCYKVTAFQQIHPCVALLSKWRNHA